MYSVFFFFNSLLNRRTPGALELARALHRHAPVTHGVEGEQRRAREAARVAAKAPKPAAPSPKPAAPERKKKGKATQGKEAPQAKPQAKEHLTDKRDWPMKMM